MNPMKSLLPLVLALPVVAHDKGHKPGVAPKADPREAVIYYDYLDNGELKGGVLAVDPNNPLHAAPAGMLPSPPEGGLLGGPAVTTLVDNGPTANRVDLVILGDGYTAAEQGTFALHVDAVLPTVLSEPPLDAYGSFFNVHRVDVISNESGVDNDPVEGIQKDTALDMTYWCGGTERLLCIGVGKAQAQAGFAPDSDTVLALANSSKYGGAGYPSSDLATLAGNNSSAIEIALHELGHSVGKLADEYTYGGPATYAGGEPGSVNLTTFTSIALESMSAKWYQWLSEPNVGTFEGGGYSVFGIYRPTVNSKMRNLGRPFEQVNIEKLIVELYKIVDPIDSATAPGVYGADHVFFVTPIAPASHALDVQWALDGNPIGGATQPEFDASSLTISPGTHVIRATVTDNTDLVRDEALRAEWMTQEIEWSVFVDGPGILPVVASAPPIQAAFPSAFEITGQVLNTVTSASIDGVPATILAQSFDSLTLLPSAPGVPGAADLELVATGGTVQLDDFLDQYPQMNVVSSGVGGEISGTISLGAPQSGLYAFGFGLGTFPVPVPIAGIGYGLLLNPAMPFQVLSSGFMTETYELSVPIPDDPTLVGLQVHLQSWTQNGLLVFFTQSFTNLASVTLE